jgi:RNA polymerase sigma factor (sigma-70 family)
MATGATDADLVQAHLAGDRGALAAIYDRYAAALYDTATYLLGDRDEAADVVQDTFVTAAQHLAQLRDPTRLRAWLFAVARHEVERRGRRRRRAVPTATVAEMATPSSIDLGADVDASELAAGLRAAAVGLDERDQLVLELCWRQGLEGADLAAALGVTPAQSYSLVFRMRERMSRSLGALLVARIGRRNCPDLAALLQGWDGTFSVLIRKRVARHVDRCDVCERTKARVALPALVAAAPAIALPGELRDRVLGAVGGDGAESAMSFDGDGFPVATERRPVARRRGGRVAAVAAVAVAVAMVAGGAMVLAQRGPAEVVTVEAPPPATSTSLGATTTATTVAPTSTSTTSTLPSTTAPTAPPTVATTAPRLVLPPEAPPTRPTIPPTRPEVDEPPQMRAVFADRAIFVGGCAPRATTVTVVATDESDVTVELAIAGPDRILRRVDAEPAGPGRWTAPVGPFARIGTAGVRAVATDADGNATTVTASLLVRPCST